MKSPSIRRILYKSLIKYALITNRFPAHSKFVVNGWKNIRRMVVIAVQNLNIALIHFPPTTNFRNLPLFLNHPKLTADLTSFCSSMHEVICHLSKIYKLHITKLQLFYIAGVERMFTILCSISLLLTLLYLV